jgi:hypothetical protein
MDWQKKVSLPKKVETCAFKENKNAEDYICKSKRIYTIGGKYGDQICAIPSPNVSYGLWNSWFGRNVLLLQQASLQSTR